MAYLDNVTNILQIQPDGLPTYVRLSQNENGRNLYFELQGNEIDIPSNATVTISGTKPDGTVYSGTGSVTDNVVLIPEMLQMTAVAGTWDAKIQITSGGNTIATGRVRFVVDADTVAPGSVPSDSELEGLVAQAQQYAETARTEAYGSPLTASTAASMTDHTRVYVYTGSESGYTAGHWYFWNGSAWTDGGIYNSVAVNTDPTLKLSGVAADAKATGDAIAAVTIETDKTLSVSDAPADAKVVGDEIASLKGDLSEITGGDEPQEITGWTHQKYINVATPNIGDTVDITNVSSFYSLKYVIVDCEEGDKFLLNLTGAGSARAWAFLTSSNVLISRADASVTLTDVTITAPQNAEKAIFQCIYRQSPDDVTTDDGTAYKLIQGTGNVVRFDIVQNKTEAEKAIAKANIGISSGDGLSDEAKVALLNMFKITAYTVEDAQDYYDVLYNALYGGIDPGDKIAVVFNDKGRTFYTDDPINTLKPHLTVTYDNEITTNYDLVGTFSNNNIQVKIGEEYSRIIQVQVEAPKYEYDTSELSLVHGYIDLSVSPYPAITMNDPRNSAAVTSKGRHKLTNSDILYPIPMPADCTNITVDLKPTTIPYTIQAWEFHPEANTSYYMSEKIGVYGVQTHTVNLSNLREVTISIQTSTIPDSCVVTFS